MPAKLIVSFNLQSRLCAEELYPDRLHGLFFSISGEALASQIHSYRNIKPFSLGFSTRSETGKRDFLLSNKLSKTEAVQKVYLEISFLEEGLFPKFLSNFMLSKESEFSLGGVKLQKIRKPYIREEFIKSYRHLFEEAPEEDRICFEFLTPTSFRKGKYNYPLPDPKLIFKGLIRKWQIFSDYKIDTDLKEEVEKIKVVGVGIKTSKIELSDLGWVVGFTGRVTFSVDSDKGKVLKWFQALSRFAEFAGVGIKTTMGFGKVKLIRDK